MNISDQTNMGGKKARFVTTHWSLIERVQTDDPDQALAELLKKYWKPVYGYLRRRGCGNEEAKDLTQGFFHEVVLNRHLFEKADQSKGRFRTFVLHALNQYLLERRRNERARKRIPKERLVSLNTMDMPAIPQMVQDADADACFHYVWKSVLLEEALAALEQSYCQRDMANHWNVFRDRIVEPALTNSPCPSLRDLCTAHGIENEAVASNMITTVKRRFRTILRECVRKTVSREEQIEDELSEIIHLFRRELQDRGNLAE